MSEDLRRILAMVREGKLSEDQGAAMIEALTERQPAQEGHSDIREELRQRRRARRRGNDHRYTDAELFENLGVNIGGEVASIIDKSLRGLNSFLGGNGRRLGPQTWLNDSNVNVLSKLHEPDGDNYTCRDNNFTVSKLDELTLTNGSFCDNELHAAAIKSAAIDGGEFRGNELRGSSVKELRVDGGSMTNCQLNGAQITDISINNGKLDDASLNGAQLRDLNVDNSTLEECMFNGAKVNGLRVSDSSSIKEMKMNGVKCRDLTVSASHIDKFRFSGVTAEGLSINESSLDDIVFRCQDWKELMGRRPLPTSIIQDLALQRFKGSGLEFINCTFSGTVFHDCEVADMRFIDVDFSGLDLDSEAAFRELANERAA